MRIIRSLLLLTGLLIAHFSPAQFRSRAVRWTADGNATLSSAKNAIIRTDVRTGTETELVSAAELTPTGGKAPITVADFAFSRDSSTVLIFTNTARVWRYNTRGDYYVLTRPKPGTSGTLRQVGAKQPSQSMLYAKLSPDGKRVAYVSKSNLFSEEIATGKTTQLTSDGTRQRINGTFDWAYEEEFGCRDGFRWSPDSKQLLYWQVDASKIRDFLMIDNTDSIYSYTIPVEYPKVGESPSPTRLGVVSATGGTTKWLTIPGDAAQHYLVRAEWFPTANPAGNELIVQQLNRKQNESIIYICQPAKNLVTPIFTETDKAWIDIKARWDRDDPTGWEWTNGGKSFLWVSEKDGWRHIYLFSRDGKTQTLLTPGNYDMAELERIDEAGGYVYFTASPDNATQRYLYRVPLNGSGKLERLSPANQAGTHGYDVSPNGQVALHTFTNSTTPPGRSWVRLPDHSPLRSGTSPGRPTQARGKNIRFFTVTTTDNVTLDGWMALPPAFDSTKRYPIVFQVYGEPAAVTTNDVFSAGNNDLFVGDMLKEGYIYAALDNRGTPALKGAAWRKSIYRQIGRMNIRDQAMGARALFARHSFIDTSRVAVWGWSGGGSTTLNLLFQYPDIYQTGIAVAAVANQLTYDNIYQERYMGLPQENREDFVAGSPISHVKGLKGNLLYIHGTGDDNVHYANAEMLVNELVKYNKMFQFMAYPNRSHGIFEGAGTRQHLSTLYTEFLKKNCPAGGR
ncbi:S9 family peptidase [Fibrella forsythiae]|uniref:S9 family peptidase n=1 Tax=Fibrella forsythiae TaxID=2817061 RepID=A0ABS3JBP5_9BACT|nr:S9 family peptidase [Fibrella forsythiae]MBO0947403.1 S9 family peptidase [Fibrella forsythiae]